MYEIFLDTLTREFSNDVIKADPIQTLIYLLINFIIAYISYKIFNLIGEKYDKPQIETKKLMNFFIFSSIYFFASGLFEILSLFYFAYPISKIGILFQFSMISIILFAFYFLSRYYLLLSVFIKFSKKKINTVSREVKNIIKIGIVFDIVIFFHLWYNYDNLVLLYNLIIFVIIFMWIIRHRKQRHKTLYTIFLLLLILIFNRINFMFIQFSYSEIYLIFDIIITGRNMGKQI